MITFCKFIRVLPTHLPFDCWLLPIGIPLNHQFSNVHY